jgi:hypothetical protein
MFNRIARKVVIKDVRLCSSDPAFSSLRKVNVAAGRTALYYRVVAVRAVIRFQDTIGSATVTLRTSSTNVYGNGNKLATGTISATTAVSNIPLISGNAFDAGTGYMQSSPDLFLHVTTGTAVTVGTSCDVEIDIVEFGQASQPTISDAIFAKWRAININTPNQQLNCFAVVNNKLYMAGSGLKDYLGVSYQGLAIFDMTTGEALSARITSGGAAINDIYVDPANDDVYIVGNFTTVNGSPRVGAAKFNSSGVLQSWDPLLTAAPTYSTVDVRRIRRDGDKFFICGSFSKVNGTTRTCLAKIFVNDASLYSNFDAKITVDNLFNSGVNCVAKISSTLYFFGNVKLLDVTSRDGKGCSVDSDTGSIQNWAPVMGGTGVNAGASIKDMATDGTNLWVAGTPSATPSRNVIAKMDISSVPGGNDSGFNAGLLSGNNGERIYVGTRYVAYTTGNNGTASNGVCLKTTGQNVNSPLNTASFLGGGVLFDETMGVILAGQVTNAGQLFVNRFYP